MTSADTSDDNSEHQSISGLLYEKFNEFKAYKLSQKICLIGSWITAAGAGMLVASSATTVVYWSFGREPIPVIKKTLAYSLATTVGGAIFTIGAAMKDDQLDTIEHENFVAQFRSYQERLEKSICQNCQFFTNNSNLYCAVNPSIACTLEAENCPDFQLNEKKLKSDTSGHFTIT